MKHVLLALLAAATVADCTVTSDPPLANPVNWASSPRGIGPQGEQP